MSFGRRIWQAAMISLARSSGLKNGMQAWAPMSELARRYVGGTAAEDAAHIAKILKGRGISASAFYMGEYVTNGGDVAVNLREKLNVAKTLSDQDLDVHVSVDPTQIGYSINKNLCFENAERIAKAIHSATNRAGLHCIMLDMEDSSVVDATISIHDALKAQGLAVAITLQAYLRRTENDMQALIDSGAKVRLVRGAFAESAKRAFTENKDIKENYWKLARLMLSLQAKKTGFYPIFGTHDEQLHKKIAQEAKDNEWRASDFEFEMLYGARPDVEADLVDRGYSVRLYVPFGKDWWPYALRRIGENPRNGFILAKSFLKM